MKKETILDPVSYTHLDVYKRQGIGGEAGDPTDTLIDVNKNTNWSDFY